MPGPRQYVIKGLFQYLIEMHLTTNYLKGFPKWKVIESHSLGIRMRYHYLCKVYERVSFSVQNVMLEGEGLTLRGRSD